MIDNKGRLINKGIANRKCSKDDLNTRRMDEDSNKVGSKQRE